MRILPLILLIASIASQTLLSSQCRADTNGAPRPLRALLIAGGCCHDYAKQQEALCKGIQERANVRVDVYWTDNSTTAPVLPLYRGLNWAADYDVIIHDECASDIKDPAIINRIVQTHQKIPAVHLHCAMHSFRLGNDVWFKHLGLRSDGHGPQEPISIEFSKIKHPITETLSDWVTENEELYNNTEVFDAVSLAVGKQVLGSGPGQRVDEAIVVWTNEKQGAKSFSTSLGHNTVTVQDPRYLELVTRGLLWACDKLTPEYLVPYTGENTTTFISKDSFPENNTDLPTAPPDATLVKVTASSTQDGNEKQFVVDGKRETRWCADGGSYPQWIQLEFEQAKKITAITIDWEKRSGVYRYKVEGSADGKEFETLIDRSENSTPAVGSEPVNAPKEYRFVRLTGLGSNAGWCSVWEIKVQGDEIGDLYPADPKSDAGAFVPFAADAYAKSGNTLPRIEKLTPQQEAEILQDVTIPEGFEKTLFAAPPAVNYPVFVASTVDGTVFVSSDGNGSLGRDPMRGRVIRLRDLDGDGRADETKVFCEIDSPRGLVWDKDRLYVMHPPHLSAFIDHDNDGIADEQKILVKNLAFGYDKRPADHTTNGLSIGVDGWLYVAVGDFGFMNAEGTDGRTLTHRGGGVVRVRPDGTGLELFSEGTRNILEVAISPNMEMFARDNTNDGDGWDVRMHHFTGNDDHGYPRLYKNFADEAVAPLADYGGGSGCGAVFIDEPGFGDWNNAPFTADWGTGAIYRHDVQPSGSTFQEMSKPQPFIKMTRPTDADVDGNSRVYAASWKGATFSWAGPNVGYIVMVQPKDNQPKPDLDYSSASSDELVEEMDSPSYRRRVEASRELARRGDKRSETLLDRAYASRNELRQLVASLQENPSWTDLFLALNSSDPVIVHTAIRVLSKQADIATLPAGVELSATGYSAWMRAIAMVHNQQIVDALVHKLEQEQDSMKRNAVLGALCRLYYLEGDWNGDSWGTRPDTRGPYFQPEKWDQSDRILDTLHTILARASVQEAAFLVDAMGRNRIQSDRGLERIIELAMTTPEAVPVAVAKLALLKDIPDEAAGILLQAVGSADTSLATKADAIVALSKTDNAEHLGPILESLSSLLDSSRVAPEALRARAIFWKSHLASKNVSMLVEIASQPDAISAELAEGALLSLAANDSNLESQSALFEGWEDTARRLRLIKLSSDLGITLLSEEILSVLDDKNQAIADAAQRAASRLKLERRPADTTSKVAEVDSAAAIKYTMDQAGSVALGQRLFTKAKCNQCHTTRQEELQKGPYLGNIAKTYKREELAVAVLDPSKTIAQGFITNLILTHDDEVISGFVTSELNDQVTLRDAQGVEHVIEKENIAERKTSTMSSMPDGLMNEFTLQEFSSLLDYLESLSK